LLLDHQTSFLAFAHFFDPDASVLRGVRDGKTLFVLLLDAVAQVGIELAHFIITVVKELVSLDHDEVCVKLLHRDNLRQFRLDGDLIQLRLSQLFLEIVVLLLHLVRIALLLFIFLITKSKIVPEVLNDL